MAGGKVRPGEDGVRPNDVNRDLDENQKRQSKAPNLYVEPSKEEDPPLGAKDDTESDGITTALAKNIN